MVNKASHLSSSHLDNSSTKPRVNDRPIRERIVHLLALQPYAKAELMLKLVKDKPLSDDEKNNLDSILHEVCVVNSRTCRYELMSEVMLSEVKEDWEFFNNTQKLYLKQNLLKARQSQSNGLTSSQHSSLASRSSAPSSLTSQSKSSSAFVLLARLAQDDAKTANEATITSLIKQNSPPSDLRPVANEMNERKTSLKQQETKSADNQNKLKETNELQVPKKLSEDLEK